MENAAYPTLSRINRALSRVLEWITISLMIMLTLIVAMAVIARLMGQSFSWYDEVAAIMLAWITYYGSALAALHRRHIGFDTVLLAMPLNLRVAALLVGELIVLVFFFLMARAGLQVLDVLAGDTLISLTWVPIQLTQSVIPIGAILFMLCQMLSLPAYLKITAAGISLEHAEIEEEVETELEKNKDRV
ncbi:TRAP dicarboxylate transporter subunit DctQ [Sulfitobacter noctilucae]|uniref:TRAP transporter small permease n=1 Tax=Sulfitobacter noctilucae TaxID=1342302 RepID=UPI0004695593|nr:TRAP transporter small permease subunit [Sulfitobacter noctilucae]KIN60539.1 TRAP dicarboxylate transporter subunit DctQ [Sulfitobacter noctilucae]